MECLLLFDDQLLRLGCKEGLLIELQLSNDILNLSKDFNCSKSLVFVVNFLHLSLIICWIFQLLDFKVLNLLVFIHKLGQIVAEFETLHWARFWKFTELWVLGQLRIYGFVGTFGPGLVEILMLSPVWGKVPVGVQYSRRIEVCAAPNDIALGHGGFLTHVSRTNSLLMQELTILVWCTIVLKHALVTRLLIGIRQLFLGRQTKVADISWHLAAELRLMVNLVAGHQDFLGRLTYGLLAFLWLGIVLDAFELQVRWCLRLWSAVKHRCIIADR